MENLTPKPLSESEAKKLLSNKPEIAGAIRSYLGHENVRELVAAVTSQEVIDLDMIFLTGQLTSEELFQYTKILPEFDQAKRKIFEAVKKMMAKLKTEMQKCKNGDDVRKTFKTGINSIIKLKMALTLGNVRNPPQMYRHNLLLNFYEISQVELFEILYDFIRKNKTPELAEVCRNIFKEGESIALNIEKMPVFQPKAYIESKVEISNFLKNPVYHSRLANITGKEQLDDKQKTQLKSAMERGHEAIVAQAQYRTIDFTKFPFEDAEIAIICEEMYGEENKQGFRQTCAVEICLDPRYKAKQPEFFNSPSGYQAACFHTRPGVFHFVLNRMSGELCYMSHQTKPISNIMSEDQYLALKRTIYNLVLNYLKSKEPDIDDLFKKREVTATLREQTEEAVKQSLAEEKPEPPRRAVSDRPEPASPAEPVIPTWNYQPWVPPTTESVQAMEIEDEQQTHDRNIEYLKRFKGIKGNKVLAVITRLLGEPVRISGSHHIFTSARNGISYPIPIHGTDEVKFQVLLASLKKWGVTLEEFNNEM